MTIYASSFRFFNSFKQDTAAKNQEEITTLVNNLLKIKKDMEAVNVKYKILINGLQSAEALIKKRIEERDYLSKQPSRNAEEQQYLDDLTLEIEKMKASLSETTNGLHKQIGVLLSILPRVFERAAAYQHRLAVLQNARGISQNAPIYSIEMLDCFNPQKMFNR